MLVRNYTEIWRVFQDRKQTKTIDRNYLFSKGHNKCLTMDSRALTCYVAEAINSSVILYTALGMNEEPITTNFRLTGTDDRKLISYDNP